MKISNLVKSVEAQGLAYRCLCRETVTWQKEMYECEWSFSKHGFQFLLTDLLLTIKISSLIYQARKTISFLLPLQIKINVGFS